jgi:hypothetical protein
LQLQTVLTAYYKDINGVQGASGRPKTNIAKSKVEDQVEAGTTQNEALQPMLQQMKTIKHKFEPLRTKRIPEQRRPERDAAADAAADAVTPAARGHSIRCRQGGASTGPQHCQ